MKSLILIIILLIATTVCPGTAMLVSENVTGSAKQCIYDYLGNKHARTVSSVHICQKTINVPDF